MTDGDREPAPPWNILIYCAATGLAILAGAALYIGLQARGERRTAEREAADRLAISPTAAAAAPAPGRPARGTPAPDPAKVIVPSAIPVLVTTWTARMPGALKLHDGHGELDLGTSTATADIPDTITVAGTGTLPTRIDCAVRGPGLTDTDLYFLKACLTAVYDTSDLDGYAIRAWTDQTVHPATGPATATRHGYRCATAAVTVLVDHDTAELSVLPGDPAQPTCAETTG